MTLKLTQQYKRKRIKKLLSELALYRSSMDYYTRLSNISDLPLRKLKIVQTHLLSMSATVQAVEEALALLSPLEQEIIRLHYIEKHPFFDVEELVHLERSSVYRYHTMAIDKIAAVLYGEETESALN
jgi:DNA-directed RNA polymerase specialized sigma subunit